MGRPALLSVLLCTTCIICYLQPGFSQKKNPYDGIRLHIKESDVLFSSRWKHPSGRNDAYDSFAAAASFHATGFVWVYSSDTTWIREIRTRGYFFQGSLNSILTDAPDLKSRDAGRILNEKGERVTAPWMTWGGSWWGCVNSPEYRKTFIEHAKVYIDAGADMLHIDDPKMNTDAVRWGGCYCMFCTEKSKKAGKKPKDIQKESTGEFFADMRKEIESYAGRKISISCNNYRGSLDFPFQYFDFGIAELPEQSASPEYVHNAVRQAAASGKRQAFTFVSYEAPLTRRIIASAYASGGHIVVPWDVYIPPDKPRYFGTAETYADLYGFVRGMADYLDNYKERYTLLRGVSDKRFSFPLVSLTDDNADISVYLRRSVTSATDVIHLVSWSGAIGGKRIRIDGELVKDKVINVIICTPAPYSAEKHAEAGKTKNYSGLVLKKKLTMNEDLTIDIATESLWAVLILENRIKKIR